jgi:predicted DCC family thiol-disulfide oxidoreductase YuxK
MTLSPSCRAVCVLYMTMDASNVVVFDGVCNLCNGAVSFILSHERDHLIQFAAAQSASGRELLLRHGLDPSDITSFVFIKGDVAYVRSDAAIEVALHLRLPWRVFCVLRVLPRRLRDSIYHLVAQNRYRWFGKRERCTVPTPEVRSRFLGA